MTAVQRLQPTFSLKKIAAPVTTIKGVACKIADSEVSGINTIEILKNIRPINSLSDLRKIARLKIAGWKTFSPRLSVSSTNIPVPKKPKRSQI